MKPVIVMPMSDPHGVMFRHLHRIQPDLKAIFSSAILSIPPETQHLQAVNIVWLKSDNFFDVIPLQANTAIGDQFLVLYTHAAQVCPDGRLLHLCYPDRVAYALQGPFRAQFIEDMQHTGASPLIFQRSARAWNTHPTIYRKLEHMVTDLGELLFGQTLDFAWCHLAVETQDLRRILSEVKHPGIEMVAEIIIHLRDHIHTRDVDWLAWEDPFILEKDPIELKSERESSNLEIRKRLGYVLPMLQILNDAYKQI